MNFLRAEPVVWALDADSLMRSFNIVAQVAENDLADKVRAMTANPPLLVTYIPEIGHNALMLGALAVEVLLKGIVLTDQAVSASIKANDRVLTKRLMSHSLRDIAQPGGVCSSQRQKQGCASAWKHFSFGPHKSIACRAATRSRVPSSAQAHLLQCTLRVRFCMRKMLAKERCRMLRIAVERGVQNGCVFAGDVPCSPLVYARGQMPVSVHLLPQNPHEAH